MLTNDVWQSMLAVSTSRATTGYDLIAFVFMPGICNYSNCRTMLMGAGEGNRFEMADF